MFIPLGKISTKAHLVTKQSFWIPSLWPDTINNEVKLFFLQEDFTLLIQRCANTEQKVKVASQVDHWQISGCPWKEILILFLSPAFCFLGPVQAVGSFSKQRGDTCLTDAHAHWQAGAGPGNYWFSLSIWPKVRNFSLVLILQKNPKSLQYGYLLSYYNLFRLGLYTMSS